jgi:hypothetical protein
MGGIGLDGATGRWSKDIAASAGDAYECCGTKATRGNTNFAVQIFGRFSWHRGDIMTGHLGSRANPALGCEELAKVYSTSNLFWIGLGANLHRVWCDLSSWSGGWTLLMKATGHGDTFAFDSEHW